MRINRSKRQSYLTERKEKLPGYAPCRRTLRSRHHRRFETKADGE
jgi:hypothetical protein